MNEDEKEKTLRLGYEGTEQHLAGQYEKAIEFYNQSLEIKPSDSSTLMLRGIAYAHISNNNAAIADFSSVIDCNDKNSVFAYGFRGMFYYQTESYDAALNDFNRAIIGRGYFGGNGEVYFKCGQIRYSRFEEDTKKAIDDFKKAAYEEPNNEIYQETLKNAQNDLKNEEYKWKKNDEVQKRNKVLSIVACILLPSAGSITTGIFIGGFWWIAAGLFSGLLIGLTVSVILNHFQTRQAVQTLEERKQRKTQIAKEMKRWADLNTEEMDSWVKREGEKREKTIRKLEEKQRLEREAEEEQKRLEEIERNRPITEKIMELDAEAQEYIEKIKMEMKDVKSKFSQLKKSQNNRLPDKAYKAYRGVKGGDDVFNSNFKEDLSDMWVKKQKNGMEIW